MNRIVHALICVFFFCDFVSAQQDKDTKLNGTFVLKDVLKSNHAFNYEFVVSNGAYTITIANPKDSSTHVAVFHEKSLDIFKATFIPLTEQILKDVTLVERENVAIKTFYQITARLEFADDQPSTSRFILKSDAVRSFLSSNASIHYSGLLSILDMEHEVKDLEIEVEYGALKNITLRTSNPGKDIVRDFLIFKNLFPFTSSSKFDPEDLQKLRLYCQNCGGNEGVIRFIRVGDLFQVDNILENNKEDYSPFNQTFLINPTTPIREVTKERRSKIIDVAAYTDFNGFDGEQPNGLIQIEASRRINLFTKHIQLGSKRDMSNYFDYGKIAGNIEFIEKPRRNKVIFKLNFKQSSYDSLRLQRFYFLKRDATTAINKRQSILAEIKLLREVQNQRDSLRRAGAVLVEASPAFSPDYSAELEYMNAFIKQLASDTLQLVNQIKSQGNRLIRDRNRFFIKDVSSRYLSDTLVKFGLTGYYRMRLKPMRIRYVNLIGYFEPIFRYSKIESNNKVLVLPDGSFVNDSIRVNPLTYFQYQKMSFGGDLNLLKMSFPQTKVNYYLDAGALWYQTAVRSGVAEDSKVLDVNGFNYHANLFAKFNPDGRWGCSLGVEYSRSFFLVKDFYFANNPEMLHYKFDAFLSTNRENKLFFRFRLNTQLNDMTNSFSQIQFGYSMNIFQSNPGSSK